MVECRTLNRVVLCLEYTSAGCVLEQDTFTPKVVDWDVKPELTVLNVLEKVSNTGLDKRDS